MASTDLIVNSSGNACSIVLFCYVATGRPSVIAWSGASSLRAGLAGTSAASHLVPSLLSRGTSLPGRFRALAHGFRQSQGLGSCSDEQSPSLFNCDGQPPKTLTKCLLMTRHIWYLTAGNRIEEAPLPSLGVHY
jgi:hypothetical protein